jgi:histidine kinase/DNA gyrase B/HSP90-like ATPase
MPTRGEPGDSPMLEVELDGGAVGDIESTLAKLLESDDELKLRFDNHWPEDSEKPALLTAALMGSLRDRQLTVDVVDQTAVEGLLRFGVATALWRRPRERTSFTEIAKDLDRPSLGTLWTSGSRAATEALFAVGEGEHVGAFGRLYATFVNPHLSSTAEGHTDVVFLVRRWLTRRLAEIRSPDTIDPIVETVGSALDELVANVQEHAAGATNPQPDCLVRLSIAASGRVRCTVIDTGVGIDESLRHKTESNATPEERLRRLVAGEIPGWDGGRGVGLPRVNQLVAACGGRLSIATGRLRLAAEPDGRLQAQNAAFALQGTVVDIATNDAR